MEVRQGYKQTEQGVIPEDWDVKPLRALANIRSGIAKNSNTSVSDPIRVHYLRVANVQDGFLDLTDMSHIEVSRSDLNRFSVLPGDVLMNEGGDLDKLGRGSIWRGEFQPCIHQNHVFVVRCGSSVSPEYLTIWSSGTKARRYFLIAGKQTTNLASINKTSLGELPVVLPTQDEQRVIVAALSDMDALLDGLDRLIAKKRAVKQATMQQLLTGQTRLPGFSGAWHIQVLGLSAELKARIGWQGLTTAEYLDSGDYCLVTGTDFIDGEIAWGGCHFVTEMRYAQDSYIQVRTGDILVTKDGTIGKVALVRELDKPATLNSGVFVIRPKEGGFAPEFFFYLLRSRAFEEFLDELSAGSTINHLYQKDFVGFSYLLPPSIEEQTAIAAVLRDMDAEITALETRRAKTRDIKLGMMQELLTGRTRLVVPAVESPGNVVDFQVEKVKAKGHNWQINEAVVISVLASRFGSEQYPLGRKRCTKLAYLLHRHVEHVAEGFRKKAAGPYNPDVKYKGPEDIAQKNGYIRPHKNGNFSGFVAADNIIQAQTYFMDWYGQEVLGWLEQFRRKTNDELELLTTVDMSVEDLKQKGSIINLENVKSVIATHPEWKPKLEREIFSDFNIRRAIRSVSVMFAEQG